MPTMFSPVRRLVLKQLACCLLAFFVFEIAARAISYGASGNTVYLLWGGLDSGLQEKLKQGLTYKDGYYKFRPSQTLTQVPWAKKPVRINSDGFRGEEFPSSGRSVATVGDSATFCLHVEDEETWPYRLGQKLGVPVMNWGISWMTTDNLLALVSHELPKHKPEVVVLYTSHNNAEKFYRQIVRGRVSRSERSLQGWVWWFKEWIKTKSLLLNLLFEWKGKWSAKKTHAEAVKKEAKPRRIQKRDFDPQAYQACLKNFEEDVLEIVRFLKASGVRVVLASQPVSLYDIAQKYGLEDVSGVYRTASAESAYEFARERFENKDGIYDFEIDAILTAEFGEILKSISEAEEVRFVDFRAVPRPVTDFIENFAHLNARGTELFASTLVPVVSAELEKNRLRTESK